MSVRLDDSIQYLYEQLLLLRRQIIELHRDEQNRKRVTYTTTPRFLSVFGIGAIDELPQADELAFK